MNIERESENVNYCKEPFVSGHYKVIETPHRVYLSPTKKSTGATTLILPDRQYLVLSELEKLEGFDGDLESLPEELRHKMKEKSKKRIQNIRGLRKSFENLAQTIDCNVEAFPAYLWVTLTYAENMTDHKRLYGDLDKFFKRARYKFGDDAIAEYIIAFEPQERHAWHAHIIIFQRRKKFVSSKELAEVWGFGFVKVNRPKCAIDSLGNYLRAYLTNFLWEETSTTSSVSLIDGTRTEKTETTKSVLKGIRLQLYPANFKFWRCSMGILRPEPKVQELVGVGQFGQMIYSNKCEAMLDNGETMTFRWYQFKR